MICAKPLMTCINLSTDNGIDVPYRKDYLPRIMKDYDGYRKHIGVDAKSEIDKAINQAYLDKNKVPQGGALPTNPKPLTQFEEREAIRKYLEGTKYTGDGTPGFTKNRVIDKIEMIYFHSMVGLRKTYRTI